MKHDSIVIIGAARTAMGGFQGDLTAATAPMLGGIAIKEAVKRSGFKSADVSELLMGCVLQAGLGQAPTRQACFEAGLPQEIPCATINKVCGSGMKSVMIAHDAILAGSADIVIAGGMESMTNAPYILEKARQGYRIGHGQMKDHMFLDGLEDAYDRGRLMGTYAEDTAQHYGFTREAQDAFAIESLTRAQRAIKDGSFSAEITPVTIKQKSGDVLVAVDEQPGKARPEKIPTLKPAFREGGTVTAANSSSISDGAAALVLTRQSLADQCGQKPLARIVAHATHAQEPRWFSTAPIGAINKVLQKAGWKKSDVDLFEINEAFAVVTMAAIKDLDLPAEKVNIRGGACALGHPIGASGARIVVTLIYALRDLGLKRGIASLCIGGGEAVSLAVEI